MKNLYTTLGIILSITFFTSCEKKPVPPVISTTTVTEISTISAVSGGNITNDGGAPIISKGICWNTTTDPSIVNSKTSESGESFSFTSNITQLLPSTSYYVRAYATNSVGTSYGKSVSFKTLGDKPVSNSQNASNIQLKTATLNGTVNPNSLETTVTFEYGITTSYGSTAAAQQSPLSGDSDGNVSIDLTELTIGTTYHFRIKAENSLGITYSSDMTFTTLGSVPTSTTQNVTNLQVNTVTLNSSVNPNYLSTTVTFEWGTTTGYGNTITPTQNPISGNTTQNINTELSGLAPETIYHFRIVATNELGTTNGEDLTFKTFAAIDADGNGYYSVNIGTQTWLTENIRTTKFSNGDLIGTTDPATKDISSESTPNYRWAPEGIESNVAIYGRLYSWYAVIDSRQICPTGWHVPSDTEWTTLTDYLINNGYGIGGSGSDIAKSMAAQSGWTTVPAEGAISNDPSNNSSGFNALPAGYRFGGNTFTNIGYTCTWWSSTEIETSTAWYRELYYSVSDINAAVTDKHVSAFSVRCIK